MAFSFDGNTKADAQGVSRGWQERVKAGVAAALVAGMAMASPGQANAATSHHTHHQESAPKAPVEPYAVAHQAALHIANDVFKTGISAFDADQKNLTQDPNLKTAEKSTVLIIRYLDPNVGDNDESKNTVEVGSGTVIRDSENDHGRNGILTAGHVIGVEVGQKYSGVDPCTVPGATCAAFLENGKPLGRLTVRAFPHSAKKAPDSYYKAVSNDAVVMDIEPFDEAAFKQIPGVRLAERIPEHVVTVHTRHEYVSGDGSKMVVGTTQGMSGGGVYDKDGGLIGVVSCGVNVHKTQEGDWGFYLNTSVSDDRSAMRGNVNLLDVVAARPESAKETGIPQPMLNIVAGRMEDKYFMPENYALIAPVTGVVHSLGDAGSDSHVGKIDEQSLTLIGNPAGRPMAISGDVKEEMPFGKTLDVKARMVNEKDQNVVKDKPVYLSLSPSL